MAIGSSPLTFGQRVRRQALLLGEGLRYAPPSQSVKEYLWRRAIMQDDLVLAQDLVILKIKPEGLRGISKANDLLHEVLQKQNEVLAKNDLFKTKTLSRDIVITGLLDFGADPHAPGPSILVPQTPNNENHSPAPSLAQWAVEKADSQLVQLLLNRQVDFATRSSTACPLIIHALNFNRQSYLLNMHDRWNIVFRCLKAGTPLFEKSPEGLCLLDFAMDESLSRVRQIAEITNQTVIVGHEEKFMVNLADWIARPHVEFKKISFSEDIFPASAILTFLFKTNSLLPNPVDSFLPVLSEMANRDAEGRSLFQAWIAGPSLHRNEWEAFLLPENTAWWKSWHAQDKKGNTLLHSLFTNPNAWNVNRTEPDLVREIFFTMLAKMPVRYRDHATHEIKACQPIIRMNAAGETPADAFTRVSVKWNPKIKAAALPFLNEKLAQDRAAKAGVFVDPITFLPEGQAALPRPIHVRRRP